MSLWFLKNEKGQYLSRGNRPDPFWVEGRDGARAIGTRDEAHAALLAWRTMYPAGAFRIVRVDLRPKKQVVQGRLSSFGAQAKTTVTIRLVICGDPTGAVELVRDILNSRKLQDTIDSMRQPDGKKHFYCLSATAESP